VTVFVITEKFNQLVLNALPLTFRGGEISAWVPMLNSPVVEFAMMGKSKAAKAKMTLSLTAL